MNYPETKDTTLEKALPYDASIDLEGRDKALKNLMGKKILYHYDGRNYPWPGHHKNVMTWWALEDGYAVGWNENPATGWSFPSLKLTQEKIEGFGKHLPHLKGSPKLLKMKIQELFPKWEIESYRQKTVKGVTNIDLTVDTDMTGVTFDNLQSLSELLNTTRINITGNQGGSVSECTDMTFGLVELQILNVKG